MKPFKSACLKLNKILENRPENQKEFIDSINAIINNEVFNRGGGLYWNRLLQEFMDMTEDDRKAYIENLRKSKELDATLERFGFYSDLLSKVFI